MTMLLPSAARSAALSTRPKLAMSTFGADFGERRVLSVARGRLAESEKPRHGERQGAVDGEVLRRVADAKTRRAPDGPGVRRDQTQQDARQGRFAAPIESDQGNDLAPRHVHIDMVEDVARRVAQAQIPCLDQPLAGLGPHLILP